jgi:hypothetical protein
MAGTQDEVRVADQATSLWSRREFFLVGGGVTAGVVLAACGSSAAPPAKKAATKAVYRSRPDLRAPLVDVTRGTSAPAGGYVCVSPSGPLMLDNDGQPVWIHPVSLGTTNFQVQTFKGEPVLTWWEGDVAKYGVGLSGEYVIMDSSYRELMRVRPHNGLPADLHEFLITPDNVAYFTAYRSYSTDLRSVGGPRKGTALDATIQGVDLTTGALVFNWSSAEHIDFAESYAPYSKKTPYDPVHVNSVDVAPDGALVVSARNTWTVYKVDPASGDIVWRLGGKKSDFAMGAQTKFAWQHDARAHPDGTISLFDDEADPAEAKQSRGLVLTVDETNKTAEVKAQYRHPGGHLLAGSQGNVQMLPDGDVFIGWGALPYYTEVRADGSLVLDAKLESGSSYRAFRFDWTGTPTDRPAIAASRAGGRTMASVSWNGSTETAGWRLLSGGDAGSLSAAADIARTGFETVIDVPASARYIAVAALDASGHVLAQSPTIKA